jgi:hypothetical protein
VVAPPPPGANTKRALPGRRNTARQARGTRNARSPPQAFGPPSGQRRANPVPAPSCRPSRAIRRAAR